MNLDYAGATWREVFADQDYSEDLGTDFLLRYGDRIWNVSESDRIAGHAFHTQLISRISTQRLAYTHGTAEAALESLRALFAEARQITGANPGAATAEILIWHALNARVRPFTAKWHPRSVGGALRALDAGNEFRRELKMVQDALRATDRALTKLFDVAGYEPVDDSGSIGAAVDGGANRYVRWWPAGSPPAETETTHMTASALEEKAVLERRDNYGISKQDWASGIALSGGGIRSAAFSLGVVAALANRNLLRQFDYLSTVSGGGYVGGFLTQLLATPASKSVGLKRDQEPFKRGRGESNQLKALRQQARFLSGAFGERVLLAMRQTHGLFVNLVLLTLIVTATALIDTLLRSLISDSITKQSTVWLPIIAILLLSFLGRRLDATDRNTKSVQILFGAPFIVPLLWFGLGLFHQSYDLVLKNAFSNVKNIFGIAIPIWMLLVSACAFIAALTSVFARIRPSIIAIATAGGALILESGVTHEFSKLEPIGYAAIFLSVTTAFALLYVFVDANFTSLHYFYRNKIASAFFLSAEGCHAKPCKISEACSKQSLFPIVNCALNVPKSENPLMRGRGSDVFSFTPVETGSALTGYQPTKDWEAANPTLDLATAVAISAAAVSPQMGLRTTRLGSIWLALLNIRLGLWLRKPGALSNSRALRFCGRLAFFRNQSVNILRRWQSQPRLEYLLHEFLNDATEDLSFLHLSDGGHIENLATYALLRRRCRYILVVDAEHDPSMTFHGLTNLQRLAYIDFGIIIDADFDDLRLGDNGLSRAHFRFCQIRYPSADGYGGGDVGYMVYVKLSITGNEGEFLRRYRSDEPSFPHHSTNDQFFTEAQFEAYRSLGEHTGESLFQDAVAGDTVKDADVDLSRWMHALKVALL